MNSVSRHGRFSWLLALGASCASSASLDSTPSAAPAPTAARAGSAYAGLALRDNPEGLVVSHVAFGPFQGDGVRSPSLWRTDLVVSVDGARVDAAGFAALLAAKRPGERLKLVYRRRADAEAHLGDAVPTGDSSGEEHSVEVVLDSWSDWRGTVGAGLRADATLADAPEGAFEATLLAHAAQAGLRARDDELADERAGNVGDEHAVELGGERDLVRTDELDGTLGGGLDALLGYLQHVQARMLDANSPPLAAWALLRPLSLDGAERVLAEQVAAFERAAREPADTGVAAARLVRAVLDGRAYEPGSDAELAASLELLRADAARHGELARATVAHHRDDV
ncbi:MAG: hypothetical protein IT453_18000, partial [Planctomycetes bacterium]|nr:hypothetical protein [Planctomycetota bacterium]